MYSTPGHGSRMAISTVCCGIACRLYMQASLKTSFCSNCKRSWGSSPDLISTGLQLDVNQVNHFLVDLQGRLDTLGMTACSAQARY